MFKPVPDEGDFYEITKEAITVKRHADFVKNAIKEYEDYKKYFSNVFIASPEAEAKNKKSLQKPEAQAIYSPYPLGDIYEFRINYLLKKPVWRDIVIWQHQTLVDLADGIIYSMDWDNDHIHGFSFPYKRGKLTEYYVSPYTIYASGWEDDPFPTYKSDQIKIREINFEKYPKIRFVFDFGANHEFDLLYKGRSRLSEELKFRDFPHFRRRRSSTVAQAK